MRFCNLSLFMRAALVFAVCWSTSSITLAQYTVPSNAPVGFPSWWFERSVIAPTNSITWPNIPGWPGDYSASDDYSAINQGTLKNLATAAIAELQAQLPAAVLTNPNAVALQNLIAGWTTNPAANADNYAAVNQGQLKYLAKQFYDVLASASYTAGLGLQPTNWTSGAYPWSTNTGADSYSLANIGQAKYVFSFDLTAPAGQLPAWWAQYYFGTTNVNPSSLSSLGDDNTLWQEYELHRNPNNFYNGIAPLLTKVSGDAQVGNLGSLVPAPLVVQVTDATGNALFNAPVVFTVQAGGGLLQASSIGTLSSSLTVRTSVSGQAKVFFQLPSSNQNNSISCTAGGGSSPPTVTFTESSSSSTLNYQSPYAPSNIGSIVNPDGSIDVTWVNNADPNDTSAMIAIDYVSGTNTANAVTVPAALQSYHIPRL